MTTPDIAGLCERLRAFHAGGYRKEAADTLERQAGEIERLRSAGAALLAVIDETDSYQKRPGNGEWGVECACCMGELFDGTDRIRINIARAALTGEDAAGSSTNQNTEPGLAFSAPVELSGNPGEPKPLMTAQELADHAADAFDDALPDDALPHEVGRAWKAVGERLAAILAERAEE
jgi:hypothetical protein